MLSTLYAFFASMFFAVLYNTRGRLLIYTALCGALGKIVFDIMEPQGIVAQFLISTIVMSIYSEFLARFCKIPVMVVLTVGILPIVPGAGVYYTIYYLLEENLAQFYIYGMKTLLSTGAMALGIMLVSSTMRLIKIMRFMLKNATHERKYLPKMK